MKNCKTVGGTVRFDPKKPPPLIASTTALRSTATRSNKLVKEWTIRRYRYRHDQRYSRFSGWNIQRLRNDGSNKTVLTYLPPIETPITDYRTLIELIYKSQKLAEQAGMMYTHIYMDCGAAMKAYHVVWNNPEKLSKVLIHHLGDFHVMQASWSMTINCTHVHTLEYMF